MPQTFSAQEKNSPPGENFRNTPNHTSQFLSQGAFFPLMRSGVRRWADIFVDVNVIEVRRRHFFDCLLLGQHGTNDGFHDLQCDIQAETQSGQTLNLGPNSNASELPPSTSRADPREGPKRTPPLVTDTTPFQTEKFHWTQGSCKGPYGILGQTVLCPSAYVDLQPWGLT